MYWTDDTAAQDRLNFVCLGLDEAVPNSVMHISSVLRVFNTIVDSLAFVALSVEFREGIRGRAN